MTYKNCKENPSKFDCYANAKPNEPMFVLLARDPSAPFLVGLWALIREKLEEDPAKIDEARACAEEMERWLKEHADAKKIDKAMAVADLWSTFSFGK
jgi:hypothetical protein